MSIVSALLFLVILAVLAVLGTVDLVIFAVYIVVSVLTFIVYATDKSAAKNGSWRTSEKALHFLSLFGGWPGALLAQRILRHKSQKRSFRLVFFATVFVNIICVCMVLYGL